MHSTFTSPPTSAGLGWDPEKGLYSADNPTDASISEEQQMKWALQESMKDGGRSPSPVTGTRSSRNVFGDLGSEPRGTKRCRSDLPTGNVLRFRDPGALLDQSHVTAGPKDTIIDLTNSKPTAPTRETDTWTCEICTCINPLQFLACDACAVERPPLKQKPITRIERKPVPPPSRQDLGWYCRECATFMEHKWWTCSGCGLMKDTS